MKIYTKTGDRGETGLFGGARVSKASLRVDVYGEVDELNSVLGLVRTEPFDVELDLLLAHIQSQLFNLGAELSASPDSKVELGIPLVAESDILGLELAIDKAEAELTHSRRSCCQAGVVPLPRCISRVPYAAARSASWCCSRRRSPCATRACATSTGSAMRCSYLRAWRTIASASQTCPG